MKINKINNNRQSFGNIYNNKAVLNGLEKISEHGASFIAGTSLLMATIVKPASISLTPNVKKENKEHAIASSITSGLIKFAMVEAVALPVENAIKKIDKNPKNYLKKETIQKLKSGAETLTKSKDYSFASQFIKLSSGLVTAIPKSMIAVSLIPVAMDLLFKNKSEGKKDNYVPVKSKKEENIFSKNFNVTPSFKGSITDSTAKGIGKILNNSSVQTVIKKYSSKGEDIARNVTIATDALLSLSFAHQTMKNKKIKEERKKPLVFNNLISTGLSIAGGYSADKLVQKGTKNFIEKFTKENKCNPKLGKYIEGINIVRPTLIFAGIYYGILPFVSTLLAEKTSENVDKRIRQKY